MVFGGTASERLQLNEDSVWSGGPEDANNPAALAALPEIRRLLQAGKYEEADRLASRTLICRGAGSGSGNGSHVPYGSYETLGDLRLDFDGVTTNVTDYRRELDLDTATAITRFTSGGSAFTRRVFASHPDQVLVVELECDHPEN